MTAPNAAQSQRRKLESWKEIANCLGVSVRTVQRWEEQSGLPVYRLQKDKGAAVFAYEDEIEYWRQSRVLAPEPSVDSGDLGEEKAKEDKGEAVTAPPEAGRKRGVWVGAAAAALVVVGLGVAMIYESRQTIGPLRSERVTATPGLESQVNVAPGGERIAYVWHQAGLTGIGIQGLQTGVTRRVTEGKAIEFSPVWSPDGKKLVFLRHLGGTNVDVMIHDGRQVKRLDFATGLDWQDTFRGGPFVQWLGDGKSLLVPGCVPERTRCWIEKLELEGLQRRRLVELAKPTLGFHLAADGRRLSIVLVEGRSLRGYTVRLDHLEEGAPRLEPVADDPRPQFALRSMPDGPLVYLRGDVAGGPSEAGANLSQMQMKTWLGARVVAMQYAGPNVDFDVSKDGRIYWSVVPFDTSLRQLEENAGRLGAAACDSTSMDRFPSLTADGKRMAYVSNREGVMNVWVCDVVSGVAENVTRLADAHVVSPRWSPDGSALAFSVGATGQPSRVGVWQRNGEYRLITPTSFSAGQPVWSLDGKSIYFIGSAEGKRKVYAIDVGGMHLREIGDTTASEIEMRRDGRMWLREHDELVLWDLTRGDKVRTKVARASLRGLDVDGLGAFVNVKVEQGMYGMEGWMYREGTAPRKIAPNLPRVMGWHIGANGKVWAVFHEPPEGDVYRSEAVVLPWWMRLMR